MSMVACTDVRGRAECTPSLVDITHSFSVHFLFMEKKPPDFFLPLGACCDELCSTLVLDWLGNVRDLCSLLVAPCATSTPEEHARCKAIDRSRVGLPEVLVVIVGTGGWCRGELDDDELRPMGGEVNATEGICVVVAVVLGMVDSEATQWLIEEIHSFIS